MVFQMRWLDSEQVVWYFKRVNLILYTAIEISNGAFDILLFGQEVRYGGPQFEIYVWLNKKYKHHEEIFNEVKFSTKVFHKVIYLLKNQEFILWITSKHKSTEFTTQSHRKKKSLNQKNQGEVKKQKLWDTHSENK